MNGRLKGSDPVFVHPKRLTVHEANAGGTLCCGNPLGKIEGWSAFECANGPFGNRG